MTPSQLSLFVKIAENGSFTRAGQELNMTQPAVSRAISTLESELGVTLLLRDRKKGMILTDIGRRLLVLFREILNGYEKVEQEVTAEKGGEIGTVRVGSFPIISTNFLPAILRVMGERYPGVQFELYEGTITEIKEWLTSRMIDIGWIIPPNDEFSIIPFYEDPLCLLIRDDHALADLPQVHIADLSGEPMILCKGGFETPIYELFEQHGADLRTKYDVHNINTALSMIQEGLGISIVSRISLTLSTLPRSVRMRTLEPQPVRQINLAVPSISEASIAVKLFIQTAKELYLK
ncbi:MULTISPECIES: LysR family transcriptional regulator [Paenibacillus]|uniref:LysR family transcriptional regulator n=1 Tax=Paenibacillus TaxID=44249 RepID=UPI0022B89669|nr:LysR family transcriptional regulator [Paenibacillus caseinilyticus]MCZ8520275.1 LysR family transcriptional regulator [Paenibacillus caseinilyticus]